MDDSKLNSEGNSREGSFPVSRDESFFSLSSPTSANSEYFTAADTLGKRSSNSEIDGSESGSLTNGDVEKMSSVESSMTLAEAESLQSYDSISDDDAQGHNNGETDLSENGIVRKATIKEDISKICTAISEKEDLDEKKRESILKATSGDGHIQELRELAISEGGLLSNSLRKRAWPFLLGISKQKIEQMDHKRLPKSFPHVTESIHDLVGLDVARVLKRFPPGLSDPQQGHLQSHLTNLICSSLEKNPSAYYYQGFHDISLTFLLVCISQQESPYIAYLCLNKMIQTCLAPYMEKTMDATHELIHVMFALIEKEDEELYKKIVLVSKCPVAFSLAWVLTWFSHTLPNDTDVFRLYDFILGSMDRITPSCLAPVFISAALVLRNGQKIKTSVRETDIASMHLALSELPKDMESLEPWLEDSYKLTIKYSGKEETLLTRAVEIKELQNELWNEDTANRNNNNRTPNGRSPESRDSLFVSFGKFMFIKYRWITIAVAALGAAYLIQWKYGGNGGGAINNMNKAIKLAVQRFTPKPLKWIFKGAAQDDELDK